jgi:hypothetical protein
VKKKNDSYLNESPSAPQTLHPFSNNRELSEEEWFALRLASTTHFRISEPKSVTKARSRIASAEVTRNHLLENGLVPVFDSFDFEGMSLKEALQRSEKGSKSWKI